MFGMGKHKFGGKWWNHSDYLKWMLVWQPLPTPLARWLHWMPLTFHQLSLFFLFVVEIVFSFGFLLNDNWRIIAAISTAILQGAIASVGNYGTFNVLTFLLCVPMMDTSASFSSLLTSLQSNLLSALFFGMMIIGGLIYLPFSSYSTNKWIFSSEISHFPWTSLRPVLDFYRLLAPFHLIHAYGVFGVPVPRKSLPVLIIQGSRDGLHWKTYKLPFFSRRPHFFAPYQPRLDHQIFYEAVQQRACFYNYLNPYFYTKYSCLDRLMQRLLERDSPVMEIFDFDPFPSSSPLMIRVLMFSFVYASLDEERRSGDCWKRSFEFTFREMTKRNPQVFRLPSPLQFSKAHVIWRRRLCTK